MNLRTTIGGLTSRQRLLAALGVVVVVVAVILAITLSGSGGSGGSDGSPSADAAASSASATESPAATSSASAGAVPGASTATASGPVDINQAPPSLEPVALDAMADTGSGVTARLASIEAVTSQAGGPGQVAGPALRVTLRIKNGSSADISLDGVAVNLSYGKNNTPGSPAEDSASAPFSGTLPAGDEAEAVYVFNVPEDSRDVVTVEVGYQPGAPLMVFSGPVD